MELKEGEKKIYTLGHSTRSFEEFLEILKIFGINLVVDVRRFPSSKKFPWFNKENLEKELRKNDIEYFHFIELGGYRKEGYENFVKSEEFENSIKRLLEIVEGKVATIVCSERFFWRCHRKYISEYLSKMGIKVIHILDKEKLYEHKPSKDLEQKMKMRVFCDKKAKKIKTTLP